MARRLILPPACASRIEAHARACFPRECCGVLEGTVVEDAIAVRLTHATANRADAADRFEIDPAEQFRLMREARARGAEIVGCYHSHPNGQPRPSPRDAEFATEDNFVWLVAALASATGPVTLTAFAARAGSFEALALLAPEAAQAL